MNFLIAILVGITTYILLPHSIRIKKSPAETTYIEITTNDLIDALRMCVQSGLAMSSSFALLARCGLSSALIRLTQSNVAVGLPVLHGATEISNDYASRMLVELLERSVRTGSPLDASLQVVSQQIRSDVHAQRIKKIRAVAVKSVIPLGLCFLPAFVLLGVVPIAVGLGSSFLH